MADIVIEGGYTSLLVDPLRFELIEASRRDSTLENGVSERCRGVLMEVMRLLGRFAVDDELVVDQRSHILTPTFDYRTPENLVGEIWLSGYGAVKELEPPAFDLDTSRAILWGRPKGNFRGREIFTLTVDDIECTETATGVHCVQGGHADLNFFQNLLPKIEKAAFGKK